MLSSVADPVDIVYGHYFVTIFSEEKRRFSSFLSDFKPGKGFLSVEKLCWQNNVRENEVQLCKV